MHFIQKSILDYLRQTSPASYAKINHTGVESGHFRYHLQQLIADGYVNQIDRGLYELSDSGMRFADKLSSGTVIPHSMPKAITYTLLTDRENYYLQLKLKDPYRGLLNMIGGKIHEDETSKKASIREVYEKSRESINGPALLGVFEIIIRKDKQLFTHAIAFVYQAEGDYSANEKLEKIPKGQLPSHDNLAPDLLPIMKTIESSDCVAVKTLKLDF